MADTRISAVVCTRNRRAYVVDAITSLVRQLINGESYEIIIVDNGSSDDTHEVIQRAFGDIPNLQYVYEPRPGLSRARNVGWQYASGDYVAYLDDDAVANPDWLLRILCAFIQRSPAPGCVGGRIRPDWEAAQPRWLPDSLVPYLTVIDHSATAGDLPDNQFLAGANMAFPRRILQQIGGFPEELGAYWDDNYIQQRLHGLSLARYYDPRILVTHRVQARRLTKSSFQRRMYMEGFAETVAWRLLQPSAPNARPIALLTSCLGLFRSPLCLLALIGASDDPTIFARRCVAYRLFGRIAAQASASDWPLNSVFRFTPSGRMRRMVG